MPNLSKTCDEPQKTCDEPRFEDLSLKLYKQIRKMTSLPAQTFNLKDRGLIREGFAADLVIFDENTITDNATFEKPHQYATGFSNIIVNGEIVFDGEKMTGKMSGQPLYRR